MHSIKRTMIFIDGSNLYHSLLGSCDRYDVDFEKFIEKLYDDSLIVGNGPVPELFRVYYYNVLRSRDNENDRSQELGFVNALRKISLVDVRMPSPRFGEVLRSENTVDIVMTIDIVEMAYKGMYDEMILVSGDGDFVPAVTTVKELGKRVHVSAFKPNLSLALQNEADAMIYLTEEYFSDIWNDEG